jgi:hypothetical protein
VGDKAGVLGSGTGQQRLDTGPVGDLHLAHT